MEERSWSPADDVLDPALSEELEESSIMPRIALPWLSSYTVFQSFQWSSVPTARQPSGPVSPTLSFMLYNTVQTSPS
ncbi:hypothetical protein SRHO_G00108730 [Serrasalmus rhombeus]